MIHMERQGGVPVAKITDVRLAECSIGDWQYNKEVKPGSHGYIAPEVLAGKRPSGIDSKVVYSSLHLTYMNPTSIFSSTYFLFHNVERSVNSMFLCMLLQVCLSCWV